MSKFLLYDQNKDPVGLLQNDISVIWLESYQQPGEVKITARATPANILYLVDGYRIYNTDGTTVARISHAVTIENGEEILLEARADLTAELLSDRVVLATERITNVEAGMYAVYKNNRRGLPIEVSAPAGYAEATDTEITWNSVLDAANTLVTVSGLGYTVDFDPETGVETFRVYRGVDRSVQDSEDFVGYLGTDVGNIYNVQIESGTTNFKNVAIVAGEGEGASRIVQTVALDGSTGENRRELYVDARDLRRILHIPAEEVVAGLEAEKAVWVQKVQEAQIALDAAQAVLADKEQASRAALEQYNSILAQVEALQTQLATLREERQIKENELAQAQADGNTQRVIELLIEISATDMQISELQTAIANTNVQAGAAKEVYDQAEIARTAADTAMRNADYVLRQCQGEVSRLDSEIAEAAKGNGKDVEMPMNQYIPLLQSRGREKLAEQLVDFSISCDVNQNNIGYGVDYFLGDRMPVKLPAYGIMASARVASARTEYEGTGKRIIITLDDFRLEEAYG